MLPASPLSTMSATLLAAVHSDASDQELQDVDWTVVSSELEALRLRTQEELAELGTALDLVEAPDRINTIEEHDEVLAVHTELKSLQPQLTLAEQHFLQLERIVRPGLTKLQTLHSRAKYLEAAVQVEKLSHEAKTQAVQATPDALEAFKTFATFAASIPDEFSVIKREAARRVEDLSVDLRQFAVEKLQLALEKIGWPEPLKTQQDFAKKETELHDVSKAFAYLLTLQLSQQPRSLAATTALWAMDCVLDPLLLRFRYHFERPESATNRLAKPEWYLSHVHEQTNAHTRLLAHALTPELHRHREEIHCWDAQILVLRGLVEAACRKLTRDLPTLLAHPPLLCHTLDEVLLFEQNIDEDIGYGSWANTDRRGYPRVIDVFTSSSDVLFAWTSADVEYAHRVLSLTLETECSGDRKQQDSVWQLDDDVYERRDGSTTSEQDLTPPVTLRFVALLDFLSQRFMLMETEEHRYLYVMQVHLPLLHRFGQVCDARGRQLISALSKNMQSSWGELFVVVNALQHVAQTLAAWEQSSVFLELSRKVARSETTRAQVLRMHVAYSKQVLARASAAVLATEEATAVRRALAGPGAMIGPTAALTAAYSVGSKTVKSLFRRAETDEKAEPPVSPPVPAVESAPPAAEANNNDNKSAEDQDDPETLVFSHTLFERQIAELKALASTLLEGGTNTLVRAVERDVETYRSSPFWTETYDDDADENQVQIMRGVSCELASCYTSVSNVLLCARKLLVSEYWPALWKPLASALDDALFDAFYNPVPQAVVTEESSRLSCAGERQFAQDIKALVAVFSAGSSKTLPRSYFCLTREVCHLLEMPASRLLDVFRALEDETADGGLEAPVEQLTTILEACGVFSLTSAQVVWICTTRLDVDARETSTSVA
ncbi:RINT-1 / TIP-1 family [Phytophthora infestans]|uniref:RINT-1 / TIP-1 family n=2 Tax=Phytophthora infestans TaxID=4787 RepID=A0A833SG81_PHYIN|nr:RINT-1 / TIP-1 family [Phytophthora infestans]KAF4144313.1 RINT-1 / TIP-1 family [Phytophthora infestans]